MSTAVSAPGKVFLAGGYLVLDRAYTALVFGLSARIHVLVHDVDVSSGATVSEIVVQSPQFRDAVWTYEYSLTAEQGVEVTQVQGYEHVSLPPRLRSLIPESVSFSVLSRGFSALCLFFLILRGPLHGAALSKFVQLPHTHYLIAPLQHRFFEIRLWKLPLPTP